MNAVSAYLAETPDEDIYVNAPEGPGHPKGTAVRLTKSIYGLKQSGRVWYKKLRITLNSHGLKRTENDLTVFTNKDHSLIPGNYFGDLLQNQCVGMTWTIN
jgi:hypothetical protein